VGNSNNSHIGGNGSEKGLEAIVGGAVREVTSEYLQPLVSSRFNDENKRRKLAHARDSGKHEQVTENDEQDSRRSPCVQAARRGRQEQCRSRQGQRRRGQLRWTLCTATKASGDEQRLLVE